jgi:hypothetical protein
MTTTTLEFNILNLDTGAVISSANATIGAVTSIANREVAVTQTANKVWVALEDGAANGQYTVYNINRDLTGVSTVGTATATGATNVNGLDCEVSANGASAATDEIYCAAWRISSGVSAVDKWTTAGNSLIATLSGTVQTYWQLGNSEDAMVLINALTSAPSFGTHIIDKATDTLTSTAFTYDWLTWMNQIYSFNGSTMTWLDAGLFLATATTGVQMENGNDDFTGGPLYAVSVNSGTGIITSVSTSPYYRISDQLYASGSGTTWTPQYTTTSPITISPTPYEETLNVPLVVDASLFFDDVIRADCDANYHMTSAFLVADDSDCTLWRVLDIDSATVGRTLPYDAAAELVHYVDYTNYNVHATTATGSPTEYYALVLYGGKDVDRGQYDAANNVQLRLAYGQCYDLQQVRILDGDVSATSRICADDVVFKESVIITTLGFTFYSLPWGATHIWDELTSMVTSVVNRNSVPYDYRVEITNSTGYLLYNSTFTAPAEQDVQAFNMTAYGPQAPFKITILDENDITRHTSWFGQGGGWLANVKVMFDEIEFNGWGILLFLPLIFAAMFTRSTAGIGGAMVAVFVGVLVFIGAIEVPEIALLFMVIAAVVGLLAYREYF